MQTVEELAFAKTFGKVLIVIGTDAVPIQPLISVPETVYVVLAAGVATTGVPVVGVTLLTGSHE